MKNAFLLTVLLSGSFLFAQNASTDNGQRGNNSSGPVTVTGCVSRSNGDYVLMKQNDTYELQAKGKTRLKDYLGQRVEVSGRQEPTLATSSDAMAKQGAAAPVTIVIKSIRTLDKECSEGNVAR